VRVAETAGWNGVEPPQAVSTKTVAQPPSATRGELGSFIATIIAWMLRVNALTKFTRFIKLRSPGSIRIRRRLLASAHGERGIERKRCKNVLLSSSTEGARFVRLR
jgi:hypothetical protein